MVFYYDFFRIVRRWKRHSTWMIAVEDLVFCLGAGCMIIAVCYTYCQGQIRAFVLLGMGLGILLYNFGISPYICGVAFFVIGKVKLVLKKITKHSRMIRKNGEKEGNDE